MEDNETLLRALDREFQEELGIRVHRAFPILKCVHDYEDKSVLLDVWEIIDYEGEASGREGQEIAWSPLTRLTELDFPAANQPIIRTLQLPRIIAITPELKCRQAFLDCIEDLVAQDVEAIQVRQKHLQAHEYLEWFQLASERVNPARIKLICNAELSVARELGAAAVHLNSAQLMASSSRPVATHTLLSVSCHSLAELKQAEEIQADMALLSPVAATAKYPAEHLLGWDQFLSLSSQVSLPIVALGGLQRDQLTVARQHGAYGVAGIRMFCGER